MLPLRDNVPTRSFPVVTVVLIAANAAVWLWEITGTSLDHDVFKYGYYPCTVQGPCLPPPDPSLPAGALSWWDGTFTSMFMHGSWAHILGNMLFLWIFGNNVEDRLGRIRFLVWYLAVLLRFRSLGGLILFAQLLEKGARLVVKARSVCIELLL